MPDYSQGKIYKIICNETKEQYFGSTTQSLTQRKYQHKFNSIHVCRNMASIEIIRRGNYDFLLCENYPCETKKQLLLRERFWIENNQCVNKNKPILFDGEKKKSQSLQYKKQFREQHKEDIAQYKKQYREQHKEDIAQYKREYRQKNKQKILEYNRQYIAKKQQLTN
jgi:hypothetical protein